MREVLQLLRSEVERVPVVGPLLDELLRQVDAGMEHQFIAVVDLPDGILLDVPVLVAGLSQQNERSSHLLQHLPDLLLAQHNVRFLPRQEVLMKRNPLLEDIGFVGVDEHRADVALHENFLGQPSARVDYQIFCLVFLGGRHESLPSVGEERRGDFSLLEVESLEGAVYHRCCCL